MSEAFEESIDPIDIATGALMDALRELRAIPANDTERVQPVVESALGNARFLLSRGGSSYTADQLTRIISALEKAI